jgi:hypothetical protein
MHIITEDIKQKRSRAKRVASSGTFDKTPGVHYAICATRQGQKQSPEFDIDGEHIKLVNGLGFTEDYDLAQKCKAKGLTVVPREKHFATGKVFSTATEAYRRNYDAIDWHRDES